MKRRSTKLIAMLMTLAMLLSMLPVTAVAADTYKLTVTITDAGVGATGNEVSDSTSYLTGDTNLVTEIGKLVADSYFDENGDPDLSSPLRGFASNAMRAKLEKGLKAYKASGDWEKFVTREMAGAEGDLLPLVSDFGTTLSDMESGKEYEITYTNPVAGDAKEGVTYTITAELTKRASSGGGVVKPVDPTPMDPIAPPADKPLIDFHPAEDGDHDLADHHDHDEVKPGDKVVIELEPEEGHRTNRVQVTDKNGNPVKITALDNDTYTFVVPVGGVTVTSTFIQNPTPVETTGVDRMLNTETTTAYIQGKADGKFHPSDSITRGQVATIFYRLLREEYAKVAQTKSFNDVPADFWCADAVNTLATLGIVNGMTDEIFDPNKPITRAQFVAICARFADVSIEGEDFHDVPETHWAYDYISTGSGFGWVNGVGGGAFDPNAPITRAQAVAIVNRMLCRIADRATIDALEEQFYHDVADHHWAWYDIGEASLGALTRE